MTMQDKETGRHEPRGQRPRFQKEYGVPETEEGLLPWSHVDERLTNARNYWLVTVRPDGRPHAVPLWGAWVDGAFYFDGGGVKVRNLKHNPAVTVHLESGDDVVILEGVAAEIARPARALFERIDASYAARYSYRPSDELKDGAEPYPEGGLYALRPRTALAWTEFPKDVTRFVFADS